MSFNGSFNTSLNMPVSFGDSGRVNQSVRSLLINEWRYGWSEPLVKVCLLLTPILAFMLGGGSQTGQLLSEPLLNESLLSKKLLVEQQYTFIFLIMLILPLLLGILSPIMLLRDGVSNMGELVRSTPISSPKRLLIRYAALVILLLTVLGLAYGAVLIAYGANLGSTGQLSFLSTLLFELTFNTGVNFVLLAMPSVMFTGAMVLWLCRKFNSCMGLYVSMGAWGMGYAMLASMAGSPILAGSSVVSEGFYQAMMWFDPYGITSLQHGLQHGLQQETKSGLTASIIEVSNTLLFNRLLFVGLSMLLVFWVVRDSDDNEQETRSQTPNTADDKVSKFAKTFQSALLQLAITPFIVLLHNRVTQLILMVWPILIFNEVASGSYYHMPEVASQLTSIDALNLVAFDMLPVLGAFIIALWSWFICGFDKRQNIEQLMSVLPISNRQMLASQIMVISAMVVLLLLMTFIGSVVGQLFVGSQVSLGHYVVQLALSGLPLMLLGAVFIGIYHLCRSPAVAGGITFLILIVKFTPITTAFGMTHTLWNIAASPLQEADNYWGYAGSLSVYLPYMTVWLLAITSFVLVAIELSHRGTGLGGLNINSVKRMPKWLWALIVLAVGAGFSLHLALVAEKPLTNSDKRSNWQGQYQAKYGHWQQQAQPSIVEIQSQVDIYPYQQTATFKLQYRLENTTNEPIEQVLVGRYGNYSYGDIAIENAQLASFDSELNQGVYQLNNALQPGAQIDMTVEFGYQQPQLWPHRSHQVVKPQFSYLRANPLLPVIGYQQDYLTAQPMKISTLDTQISTHKDHHALSQGKLIEQWTKGERAFYRYENQSDMNSLPTWLSLPHKAQTHNVNGTQLNVYAPDNSGSNAVHFDAMTDTLNWFAEHVAPYAGAQLSMVATPDTKQSASATAQIMLLNHTEGFRLPAFGYWHFDQKYQSSIYLTSQQWFEPNNVFWSQIMPKFIELQLIELRYGKKAIEQLVTDARVQIKRLSINGAQVALVDVGDEPIARYKATLAFATLREQLGDGVIIGAMKQRWDAKALGNGRDFVMALKAELKAESTANSSSDYAEKITLIDELMLGQL